MSVDRLLKKHYALLQEVIDSIKVGIFIADGKGRVLMLNKESERTGGLTREQLIGHTMHELVQMGYVTESTILNAIESKREESIIQDLGSGEKQYISGVPIIHDEKIDLIICTERDITETIELKELLKEKEQIAAKYEKELEYLRSQQLRPDSNVIVKSFEMHNVVEMAKRVGRMDSTVLLYGESGTGKELLANIIHQNSKRAEGAFIKINCAAIPENLLESELFGYEKGAFTGADKLGKAGMFELADNGTLFLDEIGEMSMQMQSKLLRVLQEHEVIRIGSDKVKSIDVRIITATNVNLPEAIADGRFREDLYYRLNVVPIELPPLRDRIEDIEELAYHFVNQFNREYNMAKVLSPAAVKCLESYNWPGNVRELRNIIERIMISFDGKEITMFQVNNQLNKKVDDTNKRDFNPREGTLEERMDAYERNLLSSMMAEHQNGSKVAEILGVNKSTISRKLRKHNIELNSTGEDTYHE